MSNEFLNILRLPDNAVGAVEGTKFRFEESPNTPCPIKYDYVVENNSAKVIIHPSEAPVKYLKLRFRGDMSFIDKVYGEAWARCSHTWFIEWRAVMPHRPLPWLFYCKDDNGKIGCYGVKTGADCFAFWQLDSHGVTLVLNLTCGADGTDLKAPLTACEIVQYFSDDNANSFDVAKQFCSMLCEKPVLPKTPIFGVNNWYWAYGDISFDKILEETDYLIKMTDGVKHQPYEIIDDGWQYNRSATCPYIGGPWLPNERFGDMSKLVDEIHSRGAKAGIWFRPLLTMGNIPKDAIIDKGDSGGLVLDPSHPFTLNYVAESAARIRSWGFDLIKHDFSTYDMGIVPNESHNQLSDFIKGNRHFYDRTKTTATIVKNLYKTIQNAVGDAEVIGCNTFGHLVAGIHSAQRVGNDTSGRSFEWTRKQGVNSMMRLPQNETFFNVDPDCAAFTEKVDPNLNLDFLEVCAITGMTTLASVTPGILTDEQISRINKIFKMADKNNLRYTIKNFDKNSNPDTFVGENDEKQYDWYKGYDGVRIIHTWID